MTANHEHTPTTEEIRKGYIGVPPHFMDDLVGAEFDRWLAAITAAAEQRGAARALRDAEKVIDVELQDSPAPNHEEDNYDAGRIDGLTFLQEHLRDRADRIANKEGGE